MIKLILSIILIVVIPTFIGVINANYTGENHDAERNENNID